MCLPATPRALLVLEHLVHELRLEQLEPEEQEHLFLVRALVLELGQQELLVEPRLVLDRELGQLERQAQRPVRQEPEPEQVRQEQREPDLELLAASALCELGESRAAGPKPFAKSPPRAARRLVRDTWPRPSWCGALAS